VKVCTAFKFLSHFSGVGLYSFQVLPSPLRSGMVQGGTRKVDTRLPGKGNSTAWRETGPPHNLDDKVDLDQ